MSKQALQGLIRGIGHFKEIRESFSQKNLEAGKFYRRASERAPHTVYLTKNGVFEQLSLIIKDPTGLNIQTLSTNKIKLMSDKVFDNIKKAFEDKGCTYDSGSNTFYVSGKNNYEMIRQVFNKAFGGKQAYGPIFEFLEQELASDVYKTERDQVISSKDSLSSKGIGFDIGHLEANITALFKASVWNSLKTDFATKAKKKHIEDFRGNSEVIEELTKLENEWLKIIKSPIGKDILYTHLLNEGIISNREDFVKLAGGFVTHTISFVRGIADGSIKATVEGEVEFTDEKTLTRVAEQAVVAVFPEYGKYNQDKGSKLEQAIISQLNMYGNKAHTKLITYLDNWLKGYKDIPGLDKPGGILKSEGSPSIEDMIGDSIYESLETGKSPNKEYGSSATQKNTKVKVGSVKIKAPSNKPLVLPKMPFPKINISRNSKTGISIVNIVNLINLQLADTIRQNMGSPKLNYRTGRFANSAKVLLGSVDRDRVLRLPYTYMKYPYQTFEIGYARGDPNRDPRKVISESIKELAVKLVLTRLRVVRV